MAVNRVNAINNIMSAFSKLSVGPKKSRKPRTQKMHVEPSRQVPMRSARAKKLETNALLKAIHNAEKEQKIAAKKSAKAARDVKKAAKAVEHAQNANFANAFGKMGI